MFHINIFQYDSIAYQVEIAFLCPFIFVVTVLYLLWTVFCIKRIRFFIRKRSFALERSRNDILENFSKLADSHKVEIVKYSFLLAVNSIEGVAVVLYGIADIGSYFEFRHNNTLQFPRTGEISNCTRNYFKVKTLQTLSSIEWPTGLCVVIGQIGLLLSMTLCICLIKFLHNNYYDIRGNFRWIIRFLIFTSFLCTIFLVFRLVPQLFLFQLIIEPFVQLIYFYFLVKNIFMFYRTLKRQTLDLRIICSENRTIQASKGITNQFALISSLNCVGIACFIIGEFAAQYLFVFEVIFSLTPCFSEYAHGKSYFQPLLITVSEVEMLTKATVIVGWLANILVAIGSMCICTHYFLVTCLVFGAKLWRDLKIRFGIGIQFRYSSLNQPFLP